MKRKLPNLLVLMIFAGLTGCSEPVNNSNSSNLKTEAKPKQVATAGINTNQSEMVVVPEAEKKNREVFSNNYNQNVPTVTRNPADDKNNNYNGRIAPDNSTFKSEMNSKGQFIETRTFNNHPQLLKAERYVAEKKILVYVKGGKVVEVAEEKLPTFQSTVPGTILRAAGIELKQEMSVTKDANVSVDQKRVN